MDVTFNNPDNLIWGCERLKRKKQAGDKYGMKIYPSMEFHGKKNFPLGCLQIVVAPPPPNYLDPEKIGLGRRFIFRLGFIRNCDHLS